MLRARKWLFSANYTLITGLPFILARCDGEACWRPMGTAIAQQDRCPSLPTDPHQGPSLLLPPLTSEAGLPAASRLQSPAESWTKQD